MATFSYEFIDAVNNFAPANNHQYSWTDENVPDLVPVNRTTVSFSDDHLLTILKDVTWGYWKFSNASEKAKAKSLGLKEPGDAIAAYASRANVNAGKVVVDWVPGLLDGTQGIGVAEVREHVLAIEKRRRFVDSKYGAREWSTLEDDPEYGYRDTDDLWFMRPGANTSYIQSIKKLAKYNVPTEEAIAKPWGEDWDSLIGSDVYNGINMHPPTDFYLIASNRRIMVKNPERRYGPIEERMSFGPSTYAVERPHGTDPNDFTSFHPGQWNWSMQNPPPILYQLKSTAADENPLHWPKPQQLTDEEGNPQFDPADGTFPILDWTFLPLRISTLEEPSQLTAWLRLDPRLTWRDITCRMIPNGRPTINALNMRVSRFQKAVDIYPWRDSRKSLIKVEKDLALGLRTPLTMFNVVYNTTRGNTPGWNYGDGEDVPVDEVVWVDYRESLKYLNLTVDETFKPQVALQKQWKFFHQRAEDTTLRGIVMPADAYQCTEFMRRGRPRKSIPDKSLVG